MVLGELGGRISRALAQMSNETFIDEDVIDACLKEICTALLQSDVNVKLVMDMRKNIKEALTSDDMGAGLNKRKILERSVFKELCGMLDGGSDKEPFKPKKGKPNVVMFVGLQGSGKTTTCTKYAYYYKKKGFKPAMICADTFRAGAYDQLKQNATKAKIPYYGDYSETDPVKIAADGVEMFKKESYDMIIVDTSGRHKQEAALFEEMRAVSEVVAPDQTIFVMDSSIGQAAHDQASAFRATVDVGAVIVTKMDGHAKGGGALSAVAATKSPIVFIGTGEHMDEFESFETKPFVSRLLGLGDWSGFMDKIQDVIPQDQQPELLQKLQEGQFSMRILYEQFQNILKMGPMGQVMSMIPGFSSELMPKGREKESQAKIKRYMCMMDSMTDEELDTSNVKLLTEPSRIIRISKGSGRHPRDVHELLEEYKRLSKMWGKMKSLKIPKKGGMSPMAQNMNVQQMSKMLPPQMLKQMGGVGALQSMMRQMEGKDMNSLMGGMGM